MINTNLEDLELYKLLGSRANDPLARVLHGLLVTIAGDAQEFLGFVRARFPSYTGHDLQHSWRIVNRLGAILKPEAKSDLSSIELFSLIVAAAFHDVGMIATEGTPEETRRQHHEFSEQFFASYASDRLNVLSEYVPRLSKCIGFVMRAHGLSWETMIASEAFKRPEKILEQPLRTNVLAVLLRIGDLLDLDSDRSCEALQRHAHQYFAVDLSSVHHERHRHVLHFNYDTTNISVTVESFTKEEHSIWSEWFSYLRQDILHANTYIFRDSLSCFQLPQPSLEVVRSRSSTYEIWPLRFELDEKGRLFEIVARSIYVGRFDYLRELIQNAIDAALARIFSHKDGAVDGDIPRRWSLDGYRPVVLVAMSGDTIEVVDNGIGMSKRDLQSFLFRVAETGFSERPAHRDRKFPSIAKFGIGFVSCLIRASSIVVTTRRRKDDDNRALEGQKVILKTEALDAFSEACECGIGTSIRLALKDRTSGLDLVDFLKRTFVYPSVPIAFVNTAQMARVVSLSAGAGLEAETEKLRGWEPQLLGDQLFDDAYRITNRVSKLYNKLERRSVALEGLWASSDICSFVNPRDVVSSFPKSPYFAFLNQQFEVVSMRKGATAVRNQGSYDLAVVWIPVRLLDEDVGIDWASLHGFIVRSDKVTRIVVSDLSRAADFDDPELATVESGEDNDTYDSDPVSNSDDDDEDEGDDDYDRGIDLWSHLSRRNRRLRTRPETERRRDEELVRRISVTTDAIVISDEEGITGLSEDHPRRTTKGRTEARRVALEAEVIEWIQKLDNSVFQDGIPLPVKGWSMAPIGACRSRCNLTGSSRFELNASRNAISESPALLRLWAEEVGIRIQRKVFSVVDRVFRDNGILYDREVIVSPWHDSKAVVADYTKAVLTQLLESSRR